MKKLLTIALVLLMALPALAQAPKREFRSVWLTSYVRIDWPSREAVGNPTKAKAELLSFIENHADRNYTGICLHVREAADANYQSSYEPWAVELTGTRGKNPGWDPLAFAVEECHKRGIECYAWVNPFRFNYRGESRSTPQDAYVRNQGWLISYGGKDVFNPALPEVRQYIYNIIREIYTNYRIDGMLFDDYFYPNSIPADSSADDYDDFVEQNPGKQPSYRNIQDWRRGNINLFMRELYAQIQNERPDLRFGVSPAGIGFKGYAAAGVDPCPVGNDWQYEDICSDPLAWLKDGSLDFISPQIYWAVSPDANRYTSAAPHTPLARWWAEVSQHFNRHFYTSTAAYMFIDGDNRPVYNNETNWADIGKQIELNRQFSAPGTCGTIAYSAKYMDGPLCSGWGDYLQAHQFQTKSLIPIVAWKEHAPLTAPVAIRTGNTLDWSTGEAAPSGHDPIRRYTVYAIPQDISASGAADLGGDGLSATYLRAIVYDQKWDIPANFRTGYWYAVCAYDGYGYESEPCLVGTPGESTTTRDQTEYSDVDGISLTNLWFRSVEAPYANFSVDGNGSLNRGMVVTPSKVFITGKNKNADPDRCFLITYDTRTGEYLGEISLPINTSGYACNDIIKDNLGNIYITNLVLNISTAPVRLYPFDPETATVGTPIELTGGSQTGRVDHVSVFADPSDPTSLTVFAAVANSSTIVRWKVENGIQTGMKAATVSAFQPAGAGNFGIAPRTHALSSLIVVVDGGNTYPTEYLFTNGSHTDYFGSDATLIPDGFQSNGFSRAPNLEVKGYASADHFAATGYKFNLISLSNARAIGHKLMWTIPQVNIGSTSSTTMSTPIDFAEFREDGVDKAYCAIYAPGNGLGVYMLTRTGGSTVLSPDAMAPDMTLCGNTVTFCTRVAVVTVYRPDGTMVAAGADTDTVELPAANGIYIVIADGRSYKVAI